MGAAPSQEERTLAGIAHLLILASFWGLLLALVIWWRERSRSPYAAFQAAQAFLYQLVVYCLEIVVALGLLFVGWFALAWFAAVFPAGGSRSDGSWILSIVLLLFLGFVVAVLAAAVLLLSLGTLVYAVYGAVRCFGGHPFRYVVIASLAERMVAATPESPHQSSPA